MARFFTGKYATMYEKVKDSKSLESNKAILSSALDEVSSEMEGISGLVDQLEGSYASKVQETFTQLITDVITTYNVITVDLEGAITELEGLSDNLSDFKSVDEEYEQLDETLTKETSRNIEKYAWINDPLLAIIDQETDKKDEKDTKKVQIIRSEWTNWQNGIDSIKRALEAYKLEIEELMSVCDSGIEALDNFNDSVVSIRLKLASIAYAQQGISLDQIENMTPEEKEKLMEAMVNAMTAKYEQYKKAYEDIITNFLGSENRDKANNLFYVYNLIMEDYKSERFFEGNSKLQVGLGLIDFITKLDETTTSDGKSFLDCVKDYANGVSFKDSGLLELYKETKGSFFNGWSDEEIEQELLASLEGDSKGKEVFESFASDLEDIRKIADEFDKNYQLSLETGTASKGLKELLDHIKYDTYYDSDEFKDFSNNGLDKWKDDSYLQQMEAKGFDTKRASLMTSSELKMYEYLFETQGADGAKTFADSIKTSLTRREGYVKATDYYIGIKSGSNEGLDAIGDAGSLFVTGYGDGVNDFVDGLVDLVSPSRELTVNEYARVALIGYLAEDDSTYGKAMLTSYNIGETVGKKTIPTILNLVKPGAGTVTEIASDTGNNIENYMRADDTVTQGAAMLHAGLDLLSDKGVDAAAKAMGIDTPVGKLAVAATKNIFQQGVDIAYDESSTFSVESFTGALAKNMTGQISNKLGSSLNDMWSETMKSNGFSEETVNRLSEGILKEISGSAASTIVDVSVAGVNTVVEASVDNAINGNNRNVIAESVNTMYDTAIKKIGDQATTIPEKLLKNTASLTSKEKTDNIDKTLKD